MLTFVLAKSSAAVETAGTAYTIDGSGAVTLGRGSKADVRIKSPNLSRTHFRFVPTSQGWSIEDLGSKNGSELNGAKVEAIEPLRTGDRIRAGDCFLDIAGVSAPIDGPKQIDVTSMGREVNDAPIEQVSVTEGDGPPIKLAEPIDEDDAFLLEPVSSTKEDDKSPAQTEPTEEDDKLLEQTAGLDKVDTPVEQSDSTDDDDFMRELEDLLS